MTSKRTVTLEAPRVTMSSRRPGRRAVVVSRFYEPEVNAGVFRLGALSRALVAAGADVTVVTSKPPVSAEAITSRPGISVKRWPVLRDRGGNVRGYLQYASFDIPLLARLAFVPGDVIVSEAPPTTGLIAGIVARIRRRPFVYYGADVWTDGVAAVGSHRLVVAIMRFLERSTIRLSSVILSVSDDVTRRFEELGARPDQMATIGHGIDTEVFSPDVEPAGAGERYFVYTGTMSEVHPPQVFMRAFATVSAEHPDVHVKIFGQGVFAQEMRELADELVPGKVAFSGVIPAAAVAQWIRGSAAALVSLTPGIGYDFAHPTKAYAAAACGTPVLFAGPDSFGDIVRSASLGEAVAHDTDAVTDAMRRLLAQAADGTTEEMRATRTAWARANVSLAAVGQRAATAVLESITSSRRARD